MTSLEQTEPASQRCDDCETGEIDDLACAAKGIQKQSEVTNESLVQLEPFKTQFETARTDYTGARDTAQADILAAWALLDTIREQLRCHVEEETREHLWQALRKVIHDIHECAGEPGCCVGECHFDPGYTGGDDDDHGPDSVAAGAEQIARLAGRIERYRKDTKKASDCFAALIKEQADLPARATQYKADLDQLEADVAADAKHQDVVRLWARLLVAKYHLDNIWKGFPTVNSYVDCLCRALVCTLRGWEATARLEGTKAALECREDAEATACLHKQTDTVAEVLSEYDKLCPPPRGGEEEESRAENW